MASSPDIPDVPTSAVKPERKVDIAPEDIQLGTTDDTGAESGKRQLKRPRTSSSTGIQV